METPGARTGRYRLLMLDAFFVTYCGIGGLSVTKFLLTLAGEDLGPFLTELVENVVDLFYLFLGF